MLYPQILLGLVASAAAIDVYFHPGRSGQCDSGAVVYTNVNPDVCIENRNGPYYYTVSYQAVPKDWHITARTYSTPICSGNFRQAAELRGRDYACLGYVGVAYWSTKYRFGHWAKRDLDAEPAAVETRTRPDLLILADGTKYDLAALSQDALAEL